MPPGNLIDFENGRKNDHGRSIDGPRSDLYFYGVKAAIRGKARKAVLRQSRQQPALEKMRRVIGIGKTELEEKSSDDWIEELRGPVDLPRRKPSR